MTRGRSTIRGSAMSIPDTSVQFSYSAASAARATMAPVTSGAPREKVLMVPLGMEA